MLKRCQAATYIAATVDDKVAAAELRQLVQTCGGRILILENVKHLCIKDGNTCFFAPSIYAICPNLQVNLQSHNITAKSHVHLCSYTMYHAPCYCKGIIKDLDIEVSGRDGLRA